LFPWAHLEILAKMLMLVFRAKGSRNVDEKRRTKGRRDRFTERRYTDFTSRPKRTQHKNQTTQKKKENMHSEEVCLAGQTTGGGCIISLLVQGAEVSDQQHRRRRYIARLEALYIKLQRIVGEKKRRSAVLLGRRKTEDGLSNGGGKSLRVFVPNFPLDRSEFIIRMDRALTSSGIKRGAKDHYIKLNRREPGEEFSTQRSSQEHTSRGVEHATGRLSQYKVQSRVRQRT